MRKFKCEGITRRTDIAYELGLQNDFNKITILSKKDKMIIMCNKVIEFMNNNNRPLRNEKNTEELILLNWLTNAKSVYKITYPCIVDIATNAGYPNLFDLIDLEQKAVDICNELIQFIKINNKVPSKESNDNNERRLGRWLSRMRQAKKHGLSRNRGSKFYPILDEIANTEGYSNLFSLTDYERNAIDKFNKVSQFIEQNNRIPITTSKNEYEYELGIWICDMRTAKANFGKTCNGTRFYKFLDEMATNIGYPTLFNYIDLEQKAINMFYEVINFIKVNGRFPTHGSKDKYELRLGNWIGTMKKAKQGKYPRGKYYSILSQLATECGYPNMFDVRNNEQVAIDKFNEIITFIKLNNTIPTPASKDKYEKQLGAWLHGRRMAKKGLGNGARFYTILDDMAIKAGLKNIFDVNCKHIIN